MAKANRFTIRNKLRLKTPTGYTELDFFKFNKYVLGHDKMGYEHQEWSDNLMDAVNVQGLHKLLRLKPRGTYKTTFYSVGLPIWLHLGDPNLRIMLANSVGENARRFLAEINGHHLRNPKLHEVQRQVYGDEYFKDGGLAIDVRKPMSTQMHLRPRTRIAKEPSIATTGYGSSLVSQHFDVIIVDDLCDRADRESKTIREDKKNWFRDLASLLDPDGLQLMIGTRWHMDDCYHYIINELNPLHEPQDRYHVEVESCYMDIGGVQVPRYPNILPESKLQEIKIDKGITEFAANYLNNPLPAETQVFKEHEMTFFDINEVRPEMNKGNMTLYGYCDPSRGLSGGDFGTVITCAVDRFGIIYVVDAVADRMATAALENLIISKVQGNAYQAFGIEDNGFQGLLFDNLKAKCSEKRIYTNLQPVQNNSNKIGRIQSLQGLTYSQENRPAQIRFRSDWQKAYPLLMEQLFNFPVAAHDDAPDALEGCVQLIKKSKVFTAGVYLAGI